MLIKAALNGGRTRAEHPAIPVSPAELAASAKECVAAGAGSIHFHVRGAHGRESLDADDVASALTAARAAVPGTPIGISTGAWILRNANLRHHAVSQWTVLPDFASVNFKEEGALALADSDTTLQIAAGSRSARVPLRTTLPLVVVAASAAELTAHEIMLAVIGKASGGRCLWAANDARDSSAMLAQAAEPQRSSA